MSENENDPGPPPVPEFDPTSTMVFPAPTQLRPRPLPDGYWHIHVEIVGGGAMDGQRARVEGSRLSLGRNPTNDLPLAQDPMISGLHARIVREGDHFWLEDLGSRNGVYIGDQRLEERALIGRGTTFTLGQTQVEFMPS